MPARLSSEEKRSDQNPERRLLLSSRTRPGMCQTSTVSHEKGETGSLKKKTPGVRRRPGAFRRGKALWSSVMAGAINGYPHEKEKIDHSIFNLLTKAE
jgi:hypothetical protein